MVFRLGARLALMSLVALSACRPPVPAESNVLSGSGNWRDEALAFYETTRVLDLNPEADFRSFTPQQGIFVTRRDGAGRVSEVRVRVLSDNPDNEIVLIGDFNDWGANVDDDHKLRAIADSPYYETITDDIRHGTQYRLRVNGRQLLDPAARLYTTTGYFERTGENPPSPYLNSVFWDFERPDAYRMRTKSVDLRGKPVVIAESEVYELVRKWPYQGRLGPSTPSRTYEFIAKSGIIDSLKKAGYNAIEFLPFNQSVDGDSWHFRYQVFGLFAPDSRYGTPDEFAMMIDAFNEAGIAVIMDAVVGHYPHTANQGVRALGPIGIHNWRTLAGANLYGDHGSPWGTHRYNYGNPHIRRFLIDSVLFMMKQYGISGIRFDNLDGIRFYDGPGGGGDVFLKDLVRELRRYRPESLLIGEMFFGHNPVLQRIDQGGYGIDFRTHSDFFDFIKDNWLKRTEDIDMERLRVALRGPWDWKEAARVQYVTNHDEAANRRDGATGQYPASLLDGGGWFYVENKIKSFAALAMLSSPVYLDMPQKRLLQEGSFYSNPSVDWSLLQHESQKRTWRFFADVSKMMIERPAFAFKNHHPDIENHMDYGNKVVSLHRKDFRTGRSYYALINLGHAGHENYRFGIDAEGSFKVLINSDERIYGGSGRMEGTMRIDSQSEGSHGKPRSLVVPYLAPYGVVLVGQES